jgi:hypothetical protein
VRIIKNTWVQSVRLNAELLNAKAGGTYCYHWDLKVILKVIFLWILNIYRSVRLVSDCHLLLIVIICFVWNFDVFYWLKVRETDKKCWPGAEELGHLQPRGIGRAAVAGSGSEWVSDYPEEMGETCEGAGASSYYCALTARRAPVIDNLLQLPCSFHLNLFLCLFPAVVVFRVLKCASADQFKPTYINVCECCYRVSAIR